MIFAALGVVRQCVTQSPGQGGIALNIGEWILRGNSFITRTTAGGDNNLGVIVSKYMPPQVYCYGHVDQTIEESCHAILDSMRATQVRQPFASDPDPRSGVMKLPYRYESCKCSHDLCTAVQNR